MRTLQCHFKMATAVSLALVMHDSNLNLIVLS
jgi:hypothetical protein